MEYAAGDKIRVIDVVNMDGIEAEWGEVLGTTMTGKYRVKVYFPGTQSDEFTLTEDEMGAWIEAPAQPAPASGDGGADAYVAQGLSAQIVHAQMVLQNALGYKENDYNASLTDLAADIEDLRGKLAASEAARAAVVEERDASMLRVVNLRYALRDVMNTSGDGDSVQDATEALERDDKAHAKALQANQQAAGAE